MMKNKTKTTNRYLSVRTPNLFR